MEHKQSPKLVPVQNQILHFEESSYGCNLYVSVSMPQAYQGNALDIGLNTFPSLVYISEEKAPKPRGPQAHGTA